ncbi:MAG: kinase [Sphingomonadaceae bacterium]|nr:kinase [Sphingomonadaceae bacterium]
MSRADPSAVSALRSAIADLLAARPGRPVVIGISGVQGCGKSVLTAALHGELLNDGISSAVLSIDDLYLPRDERLRLSRQVHPLLATRGPPGTHDIALGLEILAALHDGRAFALPRFDKARDDRLPQTAWEAGPAGCQVLLFEGWCVGARPQRAEELSAPVNELEAREDAHGIWRSYVNEALAGSYQELFAKIDFVTLLQAPGFEVVLNWRMEQEQELRRQVQNSGGAVMDEAGVARFIQHYERISRHMLDEMPHRADMVIRLDERRMPVEVVCRDIAHGREGA